MVDDAALAGAARAVPGSAGAHRAGLEHRLGRAELGSAAAAGDDQAAGELEPFEEVTGVYRREWGRAAAHRAGASR
jgi:hypothetical protein